MAVARPRIVAPPSWILDAFGGTGRALVEAFIAELFKAVAHDPNAFHGLRINSWWRSREVNDQVGGEDYSQHLIGTALDLTASEPGQLHMALTRTPGIHLGFVGLFGTEAAIAGAGEEYVHVQLAGAGVLEQYIHAVVGPPEFNLLALLSRILGLSEVAE